MRQEKIQTFQSKIFSLNKDEATNEARKKYYERQMEEELDILDSYKKKIKIKKGRFKDADEKIIDCLDPRKTKVVVEFNDRESASIKSFAVKKLNKIKMTTRFMSGKLLMFAKRSLKSFIDDLSEIFWFPTK